MFLVTLYRNIKNKHGQKTSFIILSAFLVSFIAARFYAFLSTIKDTPVLMIRNIHIHHLNFGISLLAIAGFLAFYLSNTKFHRKIVILYGIGLGLTFDEFAMWLHLEDYYWMRTSYDAVVIISVLLVNAVFFGNFWLKIFRRFSHYFNPYHKKLNRLNAWLKNSAVSFAKLCYNDFRAALYITAIVILLLLFWKAKMMLSF